MNVTGEIVWHLGDDYARLRFSETKSSFSIDIVLVPAACRCQGIGAALIAHVLHLADAMQKSVLVSVRPIGGAGEEKLERLISYYRKFGFEVTDRALTTAYMQRPPREKAGIGSLSAGGEASPRTLPSSDELSEGGL